MDLSIIIVNWNTKAYLQECLSSLPEGAGSISFETFVVDNGSRDGSASFVKSKFPDVHLIANSENRGFASANNQALKLAQGRYALLLNPDTKTHPAALQKLVGFMDEHAEAAACGPLLLNKDGTVQHAARRFPTFAFALAGKTILGRLGLFRRGYNSVKMRDVSFDRTMEVDQPSGAGLLLRRSVLQEVGLLDEGYFIFFEEVDLCRRIKDAGYKIYIYPDARITHYGGRSRRQNRAQVMLANAESMLRYFHKHEGKSKSTIFELFFRPLFVLDICADLISSSVKILYYELLHSDNNKLQRNRDLLDSCISFLKRDCLEFLFDLWEC